MLSGFLISASYKYCVSTTNTFRDIWVIAKTKIE